MTINKNGKGMLLLENNLFPKLVNDGSVSEYATQTKNKIYTMDDNKAIMTISERNPYMAGYATCIIIPTHELVFTNHIVGGENILMLLGERSFHKVDNGNRFFYKTNLYGDERNACGTSQLPIDWFMWNLRSGNYTMTICSGATYIVFHHMGYPWDCINTIPICRDTHKLVHDTCEKFNRYQDIILNDSLDFLEFKKGLKVSDQLCAKERQRIEKLEAELYKKDKD